MRTQDSFVQKIYIIFFLIFYCCYFKFQENSNLQKRDQSILKRINSTLSKLTAVLRIKKLRMLALRVFFCWFTVSLVYYGISLNSTNVR